VSAIVVHINQPKVQNTLRQQTKKRQQLCVETTSALEWQLEEAKESSNKLKEALETETMQAQVLEKKFKKVMAKHEQAKWQANNLVEALNSSGQIGDVYNIITKIATAQSDDKQSELLELL
jgi:hypothetical protein